MAEPRIPAGFDFTDPEICVHGIPHAEFAEMRRNAPVWWIPQRRGSAGFDDDGYWAVTRSMATGCPTTSSASSC